MATRWVLCLGMILTFTCACFGQVHIPGSANNTQLSARGQGRVLVMPDSAVMICSVRGQAELTQDAVVKYNDAKRRAIEALEALGIENLKIESMGMSLGMQYDEEAMMMMRNMGASGAGKPTPDIVATESMRLTLENIEDMASEDMTDVMANLIEAVQDIGLTLGGANMHQRHYGYNEGPAQLFVFQVTDTDSAVAEARRLAVEDAKASAKALAEQTGVTLGEVVYANENIQDARHHGGYEWQMYAQVAGAAGISDGSVKAVSNTFTEIPVSMNVSLGFRIATDE